MVIKSYSKADLPKPYDYKISQEKLIKRLIQVYYFFGIIEDEKETDIKLYEGFYKEAYQRPFLESIQIETAEIYSYLKEHYHIVYYMLYARPNYEDFKEHFSDLQDEVKAIYREIMEYKQ